MFIIPATSLKVERFNSYVEELRQFASTYRMHCGDPDDLRGFAAGLDGDADFRDECGSMLRAIVYRERGKAPPSELLALVAAAWGGSNVEDEAEGLQEPIRAILRFVSAVMNTSREGTLRSDNPVSALAAEPIQPADAVSAETALAVSRNDQAVTAESAILAEDEEEPLSAVERLHLAIATLERESDDVIRYVELLRQRAHAEQARRDAVVTQALPYLALRTKLLTQPTAAAPDAQPAVPAPYDPWKEDSDLQKELRRFKAERDARLAAERGARKAGSLPVKFLRQTEAVVRRVAGADNFLRRSLDRQNL